MMMLFLLQLRDKGGYANMDALDCSEECLKVARNTGVYQNCYALFFDSDRNPVFPDGMYGNQVFIAECINNV